MEKITSLAAKLQRDARRQPHLAHLILKQGELFGWDHTACAITYHPGAPDAQLYLLHEFGHALLGHRTYTRDIDLVTMERAAWERAGELATSYDITLSDELIEQALDSYRDWLHARSLCPTCGATGVQVATGTYHCLACHRDWRVNEARRCGLRRYNVTKKRPL